MNFTIAAYLLLTYTIGSLRSSPVTAAQSASSIGDVAASSKVEVRRVTPVKRKRIIIGSVADVSVSQIHGSLITVIHILDFSTDVLPKEPNLLEVRLCGDQSGGIGPMVHTDVTLVYDPSSQSRLTGCSGLISSEPWQDNSKWQTITVHFYPVNGRIKGKATSHQPHASHDPGHALTSQ